MGSRMQSISRAQRQENYDFILVLPAYADFRPLKMLISYWFYQHILILGRWRTSKMKGWATKRWPACTETAYRPESHGFRSPRGEKTLISQWFYQHIPNLGRWRSKFEGCPMNIAEKNNIKVTTFEAQESYNNKRPDLAPGRFSSTRPRF